jgi:hypothetical protein
MFYRETNATGQEPKIIFWMQDRLQAVFDKEKAYLPASTFFDAHSHNFIDQCQIAYKGKQNDKTQRGNL